jgi:hypothetical protein
MNNNHHHLHLWKIIPLNWLVVQEHIQVILTLDEQQHPEKEIIINMETIGNY